MRRLAGHFDKELLLTAAGASVLAIALFAPIVLFVTGVVAIDLLSLAFSAAGVIVAMFIVSQIDAHFLYQHARAYEQELRSEEEWPDRFLSALDAWDGIIPEDVMAEAGPRPFDQEID